MLYGQVCRVLNESDINNQLSILLINITSKTLTFIVYE